MVAHPFCSRKKTLAVQHVVHYSLHAALPIVAAYLLFKHDWKRAALFMLATMLVDADHLLANPIFDSNRCSINYHPLHTYYAIIGYALLLLAPKPWRYVALGLLLHMATDALDCYWMRHW